MKRIFSFVLAVVMIALMIPVTVSAAPADPTAVWAESITVDGMKDETYTGAGLAIGDSENDDVYGTAYFAHDNEYLYVFVEVTDSTIASKVADKKGVLDGTNTDSFANLGYNDGVAVGYNFGNGTEGNAVAGQITDENAANGGSYFYQRSKKASVGSLGRHPFAPSTTTGAKWADLNLANVKVAGQEKTTGYTAEFRIPFGKNADGTKRDVDALIANGIGILVQITDSTVGADAVAGETAPAANYVFSNTDASSLAVWGGATGVYYPAGQGGFDKLNLEAEPLRYQSLTAARTFAPLAVDGVMDDIYALSTPRVFAGTGASGDTISANVYFAYDESNLYVYADIEDATESLSPAKNNGNVTPSGRTDAFWLGLNVENSYGVALDVYGDAGVTADKDGVGMFAGMRGCTNNGWAKQGGYAFRSNGFKATSTSDENGYIVEMVIPFNTDVDGNSFAELVEGGTVAVATFFSNATTDAVNPDGKDGVAEWIIPSGSAYPTSGLNSKAYNVNDTETYSWDELTFEVAVPDSLTVTANPTKTSYNVGETLDATGLTVNAVYYTGTTYEASVEIPVEDLTLTYGSGVDASTPFTASGNVTVSVDYAGLTATFDVEVKAATINSLTVKTNPNKTNYIEGEKLDITGIEVIANITDDVNPDGHDVDVTADVTYMPDLNTKLTTSDTEVTVAYGGKTATFAITVASKTIDHIVIAQRPTFTSLRFADNFKVDGLRVNAVYDNGDTLDVTANVTFSVDGKEITTSTNVGDFFGNVAGTYTVTITYNDGTNDFTASYEIEAAEERYQVPKAHEAAKSLTIDGKKDDVYTLTSPLVISGTNDEDGNELSAKMWFAYDSRYIYVYGEVIDSTKHANSSASTGNITPLSKNDALILSLNVDPTQGWGPECNIWTSGQAGGITEDKDASGIFGVMRGCTTANPQSRSGGYAWGTLLNEGTNYTAYTEENADGYVVEFAIPWMKSMTEGQNFYEMAKANGIAIRGTLINSTVDNGGSWQVLHSEPSAKPTGWRDEMYTFNGDQTYTWDKLEFIALDGVAVDTSNAYTIFSVGDLFTSEGVEANMTWKDGKELTSGDIETEADIYLTRAFATAGKHEIRVISGGEVVGTYMIEVEGTPETGDVAAVLIPLAIAAGTLALAGIVILTRKKGRA